MIRRAAAPRAAALRPGFPVLDLAMAAAWLLAVAAALALVLTERSALAAALLLALPAGLALLYRPGLAVPLVVFAIYTNAMVVAVHFHGLPFIAAAALPLLLLLPITADLGSGDGRLLFTPTFAVLLAFVVVQFAGALASVQPERSLANMVPDATEGILLYLLVSNAARTPGRLKAAMIALIAAGALIGAIGAHQQLTGSFDSNYGGFAQVTDASFESGVEGVRQPRLAGPIGEKNRFSQIMAMLIPVALFMGMAARLLVQRALAFGGLTLILIGCSLGFSRGAVVGVGMMFLAMLALGYVRRRHLVYAAIAVAIAGLAVPQYAARIASLGDVAKSLTSEGGGANADGATRGRITEMWTSALVFADHPWLGAGPGMNRVLYPEYARVAGGKVVPEERRAHSLYPGLAAEHGVAGVVLFTAMLGFTFRDLARARRRWRERDPQLSAIATALIMSLIVYLTTSLFLHTAYVRYFWLLMALAGAASHLATRSRATGEEAWLHS